MHKNNFSFISSQVSPCLFALHAFRTARTHAVTSDLRHFPLTPLLELGIA
jgi:hypothetical protein